jgi:hypothetical protein
MRVCRPMCFIFGSEGVVHRGRFFLSSSTLFPSLPSSFPLLQVLVVYLCVLIVLHCYQCDSSPRSLILCYRPHKHGVGGTSFLLPLSPHWCMYLGLAQLRLPAGLV